VVIKPDVLYKYLCQDLTDSIGDSLSCLYGKEVYPVGLSPREYAALAISNSFLKKYSEDAEAEAEPRALAKFMESNRLCASWALQLPTSLDEELYGGFKKAVYDFFNPECRINGSKTHCCMELDPFAVVREGDVGPGSNIGARGQDFYTKLFDSPLSCTSLELYRVYTRSMTGSDRTRGAEKARSERYPEPILCKGNRLSFVPKTNKIARVICVEPTLNMFFQMGVRERLEVRLKEKYGICLSRQPSLNRALARLGSLGGGFVTIDLESASDSMSVAMLEDVLPRAVFNSLMKYRSPITTLPDGVELELGMLSSMGNAFTFPLQTAIFASVVCSVYRYLNIPIDKPGDDWYGNFGVFGDDIACRTEAARYVVRLLNILGFRVNQSKSFLEGPFRESCGADFYHGRQVRGVYLRSSRPDSLLSTLNLLTEFSANTGIALPKLSRGLRASLAKHLLPVPRWENDEAGWKVPVSFFSPKVDRNGTYLYKAFVPIPSRLRIGEGEIKGPNHAKKRALNPDGLYCAFLKGAVDCMTINLRQKVTRYSKKMRWAPNWQYASHLPAETTRGPLWVLRANWKRWETAFYYNL